MRLAFLRLCMLCPLWIWDRLPANLTDCIVFAYVDALEGKKVRA